VVADDRAGLPEPYVVSAPGAIPERLAAIGERVLPVARCGRGLLVRHDRGGDETWQVSVLTAGATLIPMTHEPRVIHRSLHVAPGGRRLGLAYNPDGGVDFRIAVLDLETGAIDDWMAGTGSWDFTSWHPDGGAATVTLTHSASCVETWIIGGDAAKRLLPAAGRAMHAGWAGDRLLALTDLGSDFLRLVELDASDPTRAPRVVLACEHDVTAWVPDPSGRRAVVAVNAGFGDELVVVDIDTGKASARFELPPGIVYTDNVNPPESQIAWSEDGSSVFLAWETPTEPARILEVRSRRTAQWTVPPRPLPPTVAPIEASYGSFDGLEIPGLHYRSTASSPNGRPTVVWFHGGPESQFRAGFQPGIQVLCAAGLDVLAPNVRGSSGYGLSYLGLDDRERRWDSVRDGSAAAQMLIQSRQASKVAAMGASYGGYMTVAVLVDSPELWSAGVDIVGIADLVTFIRNTSPWRRSLRAAEYGDPDAGDEAFMVELSPLRRADRIRAPLLVLHGRNDVRVPLSEAKQLVERVPRAELRVYDDEGHGLVRHQNRVDGYGRAAEFLLEHLS
jgi:dipeptidyl aminopeptidase/acylaminoacyl peptidase